MKRASNDNASHGKFDQKYAPAYSDSYFSFSASVANTPIMLIDPGLNQNGVVLLGVNISEQAAVTPWFALLATSHNPPSGISDGDIILAANNASSTQAQGSLPFPLYIEPNKGLFLFPLVASTMGTRQIIFRKI